MEAASRALEVTVISGEGLRVDRRSPVKKNAFVVVRTNSRNSRTTKMDREGGSCPAWNEKLVVDMPVHAHSLTVEVQCKTSSGDKVVGTAIVPVSDFSGGFIPDNYLHFLSYRLRNSKGERNGIINLSVRVKVPETGVKAETCAATSCPQPWMGFPAAETVSSGIVTGVPVWYRH